MRIIIDILVYSKPYPFQMALKAEVERQIEDIPYNGIVDKKRTVLAKEKIFNDHVSYSRNKCEILSNLGKNELFTVIDLKDGFHYNTPLRI